MDRDLLQTWVKECGSRCLKSLRAAFGGIAEDALQDVMVEMLKRSNDCKLTGEDLCRYIHRSGRNACLDIIRQTNGQKHCEQQYCQGCKPESTAAQPAEPDSRLKQCLDRLNEPERNIVSRRKAGDSPAEIAVEFGLNAANVRLIVHRALRKLRECLESGGISFEDLIE